MGFWSSPFHATGAHSIPQKQCDPTDFFSILIQNLQNDESSSSEEEEQEGDDDKDEEEEEDQEKQPQYQVDNEERSPVPDFETFVFHQGAAIDVDDAHHTFNASIQDSNNQSPNYDLVAKNLADELQSTPTMSSPVKPYISGTNHRSSLHWFDRDVTDEDGNRFNKFRFCNDTFHSKISRDALEKVLKTVEFDSNGSLIEPTWRPDLPHGSKIGLLHKAFRGLTPPHFAFRGDHINILKLGSVGKTHPYLIGSCCVISSIQSN